MGDLRLLTLMGLFTLCSSRSGPADDYRIIADQAVDTLPGVQESRGGVTVHRRNAFAVTRFTTAATSLRVAVLASVGSVPETPNRASVAVYVNGAFHSQLLTTSVDVVQYFTVSLSPGTKTVELWDGSQHLETVVKGTYVYAVEGDIALQTSVSATSRLVLIGDSCVVGDESTYSHEDSYAALTRLDFPGRVALEAWGSRSLGGETVATLAARIVALAAGSTNRYAWIALGLNDCLASVISAADFATKMGQLLDAVHALDSGLLLFVATPAIVLPPDTGDNAFGDNIEDYRVACETAVVGRSPWATSVDMRTVLLSGDSSDGIHYNDGGHSKYAVALKATVGW